MAIAPPQIPGLTDWRPLARGGFATVWRARQESLNRLVAVKVDERTLEVASERRRFLRESGAAGQMSGHPGIVTVHDAGILADDRPYLVMELLPGGSLNRWLKPGERPSQVRVRDVGVRIADALAAAHGRGVLHRDVKPANILIDAYGHPGLADFGMATLPESEDELFDTLQAITPAYAPPEAFDAAPPTQYGDVFSLAATLYAVLAGRPPRGNGDGPPSVAEAREWQQRPIEPIAGVDPALMALLLAALADEPAARPTAAQFRDRLAALGSLEPASAPAALPVWSGTSAGYGTSDQSVAPAASAGSTPGGSIASAGSSALREGSAVRPGARRRPVVALTAAAVLLALALLGGVALLRPDAPRGSAVPVATSASPTPATESSPTPPGEPSSSSPSSSPPATGVPAGYLACSEQLGGDTFCPLTDECWGGIFTYSDQPALGTPQSCTRSHVYQTFAAGRLPYEIRRQSQLEGDPQAKGVCSVDVVNEMLREQDRRDDWEVLALPPQRQDGDDDLYRCIFGRGERTGPFPLSLPG